MLNKNLMEYNLDLVDYYGNSIAEKYNFDEHNVLWHLEGESKLVFITGDTENMTGAQIDAAIQEFVTALNENEK